MSTLKGKQEASMVATAGIPFSECFGQEVLPLQRKVLEGLVT